MNRRSAKVRTQRESGDRLEKVSRKPELLCLRKWTQEMVLSIGHMTGPESQVLHLQSLHP